MYLQPTKVFSDNGIVIWQKVLETAQGGFALDASGLTAGNTIKAGTPMAFDETTRLAKPAAADGTDVKGLLYADVVIDDGAPTDVVLRGTIYENRIDAVSDENKAAIPLIIFSQSY